MKEFLQRARKAARTTTEPIRSPRAGALDAVKRSPLLYITPIMPQSRGNGLAMRAGLILEALAKHHEVHLFVAPVAGDSGEAPEFVRKQTARIGVLPLRESLDTHYSLLARLLDPQARFQAELAYPKPQLSRFCTLPATARLREWIAGVNFRAVHVMRLYLAPLVDTFLRLPAARRPFCVLDLDDDEACTRQRLARIAEQNGDTEAAMLETAEAQKYREFQKSYFPRFDRILVCSAGDAARVGAEFPNARFMIVPNGYRLPHEPPARASSDPKLLRLLFVGNLHYYPNSDAAVYLCRKVLPRLRRLTTRRIRIDLAGAGAAATVGTLASESEVRVHDLVLDLTALYAAADTLVVPLRAGGGTRIKILEAFARGVPVVSTAIGAEGIEAFDNVHLLLADTPERFARACLRIKEHPEISLKLACNSVALLAGNYSPAAIQRSVAAAYQGTDCIAAA